MVLHLDVAREGSNLRSCTREFVAPFMGSTSRIRQSLQRDRLPRKQSLPLTYEVADLNFVELPEKTFDLVAAQTSLHHILFLERVAEQVWRSLKNDGYLWIHDFVGEMRWQYDSKRPEPGSLGSPFESIRSSEIISIFQRWFTIEWKLEFSAFLHLIVPPGTRTANVKSDDTKALFEVLLLLDHVCVQEKILQPTGGQYLMQAKAC
jgi:SAM-dependent methyltransferase